MSTTPVTVRNAIDASVKQSDPNKGLPTAERLRVRSADTGQANYAFVKFARPFPLSASIVSAKLRIYSADVATWPAMTRTVTVKRVTEAWKQGQLVYSNRPAVTTTGQVAVTKFTSIPKDTLWEFDVTAMMQLVADNTDWYGFRLEINEDAVRRFYSAQANSHKPVLEVVYTTPPEAPTTLSPAGNRSVTAEKPILRFDFTDRSGSTSLSAVQVQINATDQWTSPAFDSGTVLTSDQQLDLATTAYAGLADGASAYWRVRVQDSAGTWSLWSDAVQFSRATLGTPEFTSPAASPSNFVYEATPTLTWTFTGRTQSAWQVIILNAAGDWLHSSGKLTSAATSYTLPVGIVHPLLSYTAVLRVWDTINREQTPGAPAFAETTRQFTMTTSGSVSGVTGLTVTNEAPGVRLDFARTSPPASFTVIRDDKVIAADLDPLDLSTGGNNYSYRDYGAAPGRSQTWEVRAVDGGQQSAGTPQSLTTGDNAGIWLSDPEREISVRILGTDPGTWSMGEDAENHIAVGAVAPIRITQGLRGYEGNIRGTLATVDGVSVETAVANMWLLKAAPGTRYLLTLADLSIPVIIGNVTISPDPSREIIKRVSFDFWQVDDLPFEVSL